MKDFVYYRCSGSASYRFGGERICRNSQVQGAFSEDDSVARSFQSSREPWEDRTRGTGKQQGWYFVRQPRDSKVAQYQATTCRGKADRQLYRGLNRKRTIHVTDGSNQTPHRRSRSKDQGECRRCRSTRVPSTCNEPVL